MENIILIIQHVFMLLCSIVALVVLRKYWLSVRPLTRKQLYNRIDDMETEIMNLKTDISILQRNTNRKYIRLLRVNNKLTKALNKSNERSKHKN